MLVSRAISAEMSQFTHLHTYYIIYIYFFVYTYIFFQHSLSNIYRLASVDLSIVNLSQLLLAKLWFFFLVNVDTCGWHFDTHEETRYPVALLTHQSATFSQPSPHGSRTTELAIHNPPQSRSTRPSRRIRLGRGASDYARVLFFALGARELLHTLIIRSRWCSHTLARYSLALARTRSHRARPRFFFARAARVIDSLVFT